MTRSSPAGGASITTPASASTRARNPCRSSSSRRVDRYQAAPLPSSLRVSAAPPAAGPSTNDATAVAPSSTISSLHTRPVVPSSSRVGSPARSGWNSSIESPSTSRRRPGNGPAGTASFSSAMPEKYETASTPPPST